MPDREDDSLTAQGGEFGLIESILAGSSAQNESVAVGPGDDAAVLATRGHTVVTTDMLCEGVHFRLDWIKPYQAGWRAAIASISDLAAMGATPTAGFLSLGIPSSTTFRAAKAFGTGVLKGLENYGATLAGGDVVRTSDSVVLNVTAIGDAAQRQVLRSGAKVGDVVCVTGRLGGSQGAIRVLETLGPEEAYRLHFSLIKCYFMPHARVQTGRWLATQPGVHSMMDLSDGLASDSAKLAAASNLRIEIDLRKLPYHPDLIPVSRVIGENPLRTGLLGGEDFELLFTVAPEQAEQIAAELLIYGGSQATVVGRVLEGSGAGLIDESGKHVPMPEGYQHFGGSASG